jgi:aryl-alcohol dehydrogenase-like predicted oxidoreductase
VRAAERFLVDTGPLPGAAWSGVERRAFGQTNLRVSEFGLGCARIGGIFQQDTRGFLDLLSGALDHGINFFDTADMYSQGESERLVGRAFRARRSDVIISTKAGYQLPGRRRFAARLKPILRPAIRLLGLRRDRLPASARGALAQNFSPAYLRAAAEASLRRLRTDYIDLFQLHSPPADVVAAGEWEGALDSLKRSGKIRHYGISCDTVEAAAAALRFTGVSFLQLTVSLVELRAVDAVLPEAKAKGVAVIARECLANGLLVKPTESVDLSAYCRSPEEQRVRAEQLATLRRQAAESGISLARLALDYVRGLEGVSVALLGARTVAQLRGLLDEAAPRAAVTAGAHP